MSLSELHLLKIKEIEKYGVNSLGLTLVKLRKIKTVGKVKSFAFNKFLLVLIKFLF